VQVFLDAEYRQQHILEVILGLSHKVISNYTNHVAKTPVDAVFRKFAWEKPAATEAAVVAGVNPRLFAAVLTEISAFVMK